MIQAFFLVCCGPQPKDVKQDGRLADSLHFGVILHTIMNIARQCQDRKLQLIFYTATRRNEAHHRIQPFNPHGYGMGNHMAHSEQSSWISVDPRGGITLAAPADGQSHCCHDNRKIQSAQVKNWQVENYSLAIGLSMEEKGDVIYDFGIDGQLVPTDRLKGHPSATYVELIWDMRRIMVSREKALKLPSIRTPLVKDGKFELRVPECSLSVFRLLYDFMQFRETWQEPGETLAKSTSTHTVGPPVLRNPYALSIGPSGMLNHIRVFKTAGDMKFKELQYYAFKRLYGMNTTSDDPIEALREIYNEHIQDNGPPIHSELHKWSRKFLARSEDGGASHNHLGYSGRGTFFGVTNYAELRAHYRFQELHRRNMALQDDCRLVYVEMVASGIVDPLQAQLSQSYDLPDPIAPIVRLPSPRRRLLPRTRSLSNLRPPCVDSFPSTARSISGHSLDDTLYNPFTATNRSLEWELLFRLGTTNRLGYFTHLSVAMDA